MITEHDIMIDAIAPDIFEDFHIAIDEEAVRIMDERGINQETMNIVIDAFFFHNNATKEHKKRRQNGHKQPVKQKLA
jgi:hypothetical protein